MNRFLPALAFVLVLVGCSPVPEAPQPVPSLAPTSGVVQPQESTVVHNPEASSAGVPELVLEGWDEDRYARDARWLFAVPGRYGAERFDAGDVADAVRAYQPRDGFELSRALILLTQEDYLPDVQRIEDFLPSAGPPSAPSVGGPQLPAVGRPHFAFVLDASGSMAAAEGAGTRMTAAKEALLGYTAELPEHATVSLRVYGHRGSNAERDKAHSCEATEVLFAGMAGDAGLAAALADVRPVGWTPLAQGIADAADDVPPDATDVLVYVVTDGVETCGGDPVAAARDVAERGASTIVNVIGFSVGNAEHGALRAVADAGGGRFTAVGSTEELERHFAQERERIADALRQWEEAAADEVRQALAQQAAEMAAIRDDLLVLAGRQDDRMRQVLDLLEQGGDVSISDALFARQDLRSRSLGISTALANLRVEVDDKYTAVRDAALDEIYETSDSRWAEIYGEG